MTFRAISRKALCLTLLYALAGQSLAAVQWQDFSVSYLKGENYQVGDPKRDVITFEHAAGTTWGDSFMFLDHIRSDDGGRTNYAEWAPRLSLCKMQWYCARSDNNKGLIADLLLSSTLEMGDGFTNLLYGAGIQLNLPGFRYFNVNLYRRDHDFKADNWQTTITWGYPFTLGGQNLLYDGFLDWYSTTRDERAALNWTSQLKWDISPLVGTETRLYLGLEYNYWINKFGIPDSPAFVTDERNLNLLVKWHF